MNGNGVHFNGTSWTARQNVSNSTMNAVHAYDANNVWAVGELGAASRWDGTTWTRIYVTGFPISVDVNLTSVYVEAPDSVWAVAGASGNLFHWNGTAWRLASVTEQPSGARAITVLSGGKLRTVGSGMQIAR